MSHRNPRRDTFWPTHVRVNDEIVSISSLLESGAAVADIRGNAAEGWACYLYHPDHPATAQQISAVFSREQGDTRAQILAAAARTYGRVIKPSKYMHPAVECWPFPTYPKPKTPAEIEAEQQKKIAARVESARNRFGNDTAGCLEWLDTERKQCLYIAANSMNLRERDERTKEAALLVHAIEQIKANPSPEVMHEIAQAEATQAAPITAADDIAFWTLEAAKNADVPLWANLGIPADVAEDIDAANWSVGSGLKNTTARRELFREKRAAAYAEVFPDHAAELAVEKAAQIEVTEAEDGSADAAFIAEHFGVSGKTKIAQEIQKIGRGTRVITHRAELIAQEPTAVQLTIEKRASGAAAHIAELEEEIKKLKAENERLKASQEKTERLLAEPMERPGEPIWTVIAMAWNGSRHADLVRVRFRSRQGAECYREMMQLDYKLPLIEQQDRLAGIILDRNKAAKEADAASGITSENPATGWEREV